MDLNESISVVLSSFGIGDEKLSVQRINSGHINYTFKIGSDYILQRINKKVFREPEVLSHNLRTASDYLKRIAPKYHFLTAIRNDAGLDMTYDQEGFPWRLFPFVHDTITIDEVANTSQAYEAAKAFGRLSKLLDGCDVSLFKETIPQFHNLSHRGMQFEEALYRASSERKTRAKKLCNDYVAFNHLIKKYESLIESKQLKLRIMHNDTKINNVLFDKEAKRVICVIDLDTLMPGYFIYDLGDMIRTFVSPTSEDEADSSKTIVRKEIYQAILDGYLSEMGSVMTEDEMAAIPWAGLIMTYMIGLRFLIDYLSGDTYFQISYPDQNLNRAANQFILLEKLAS